MRFGFCEESREFRAVGGESLGVLPDGDDRHLAPAHAGSLVGHSAFLTSSGSSASLDPAERTPRLSGRGAPCDPAPTT